MLVSVVTPCLNPGPALRRCVASVAAQTHAQVEHIVMDGGSTDGTVEQLQEAEGVRWVSEPDSGQSEAINKGFRIAAGGLLTWLNADDELLPDAAARAVAAIEVEPDVGWVYGDCEIVEGTGSGIRVPAAALDEGSFLWGNAIAQPGTFFTRAALELAGGIDERLRLAMDFDLWVRLTDAGVRARYVPRTLARFHITPESKTGFHGHSVFLAEEALSFKLRGHPRAAAVAAGRAAAWSARSDDTVDPATLRREVAQLAVSLDVDRGVAAAAARVEAAILERPSRRTWFRHLLAPGPWRVPETRVRALGGVTGLARRAVSR
jgi:GT2 family glycosyltransferase